MENTTMQAMQTQPAHTRLGQRAEQQCALSTDRSAVLPTSTAIPAGDLHRGWNRVVAAHTEGALSFGMFSVRPSTLSTDGSGYAGSIDAKGDRLGSPAWSPPV